MTTLPTKCELCPRQCGANRAAGQRGLCGADDTLVVARAALHAWEEPPISAGRGSGTVFFAHCPLRCCYCQNAELAHQGQGIPISVERLGHIFLELQAEGALNVNLVTPTHYVVQIKQAVADARVAGLAIPVVYNTSGYERAEVIAGLAGTVDVYLTDFKYGRSGESDAAERYSHAPDYFDYALAALDAMVESMGPAVFEDQDGWQVIKRGVIVRHMLLPGRSGESKRIIAQLWERYRTSVVYSIMSQYTPVRAVPGCPELSEPVAHREYEEVLDFADALGMDQYYWQEGDPADASFIPAWDGAGVLPRHHSE